MKSIMQFSSKSDDYQIITKFQYLVSTLKLVQYFHIFSLCLHWETLTNSFVRNTPKLWQKCNFPTPNNFFKRNIAEFCFLKERDRKSSNQRVIFFTEITRDAQIFF